MNFEKNNNPLAGPRVLVAPLDWGLGHATRCIPIICGLQQQGATVYIAAEGKLKTLLEKELKQVVFLPLAGYNIHYSKDPYWFPFSILLQVPKIMVRIYKENRWLKSAVKQYGFDAVIADNRPGLYTNKVPCIYITHQLTIKTGNVVTAWLAQKMHYYFINKYSACWVPDNFENKTLAGDLSHPQKTPRLPLQYLGPLSRFEKTEIAKKYEVLVLLSGPEPQRTFFEKKLLEELRPFTGNVLFIRGLPGESPELTPQNKNITMHNHLPAATLGMAIQQSKMVICRSGYTTIMDLVALQQKAVVVPTPGQTEQEYLAKYLMENGLFPCMVQENFSLLAALQTAAGFTYKVLDTHLHQYKKVIQDFVSVLKNRSVI